MVAQQEDPGGGVGPVDEWAREEAQREELLGKAASRKETAALHYGTAAGLLSRTPARQDRAVSLFVRGTAYRGESLRRFADGVQRGLALHLAVSTYVDGRTADAWAEDREDEGA